MKISITKDLPKEGYADYIGRYDFNVNSDDRPFDLNGLREFLKGSHGVLCSGNRFGPEIMDALPELKIVASYGVGYDNIDVTHATRKGIAVANLPGVVTESTAELTWGLILAVARRIAEADRYVRTSEQFTPSLKLMLGMHLYGKRLGIVGMGRIGMAVARRAMPFGMEVVYFDQMRNKEAEIGTAAGMGTAADTQTAAGAGIVAGTGMGLSARYVDKDTLLRTSDVVSLHLPLTESSFHFIDTRDFDLMKNSAFLINMARGPVVNEKALIDALKSGKIAGAGLDVYENEPAVPLALRQLENAVLTPHIGTSTVETRIQMTRMGVETIIKYLSGEKPPNIVNPEIFG